MSIYIYQPFTMTRSSEHRVNNMTVTETSRKSGDDIFDLQVERFKIYLKVPVLLCYDMRLSTLPSLSLFSRGVPSVG